MPDSLVLGVDPGAKWCGLALVRGRDALVAWNLLERPEDQDIRVWVEECCHRARALLRGQVFLNLASEFHVVTVAVEAVVKPQSHINGKLRINSPESLIGTAAVMGGMISWAATEGFPVVLVPPGKNGEGPRQAYPAELWGPREGPAGTGKLNHVRSAYSCALAGPGLLRRAQPERLAT